MNDTLQNAISLFVGAMTTVLLMAGNYYFGGRRRDQRKDETEKEDQDNGVHRELEEG